MVSLCDCSLWLFDAGMQDEAILREYLGGSVSPPPVKRRRIDSPRKISDAKTTLRQTPTVPTPAAVEAGQVTIDDHLKYFTELFKKLPGLSALNNLAQPSLSLPAFVDIYSRSAGSDSGHNFVIHQHDHPRAGLHYDLRLQINPTSSCSWSIPYGLPGNPWEQRHGRRLAIETRIHCLWNHLIEAASKDTGSMLIWDFGEFEILPFDNEHKNVVLTDDEGSSSDCSEGRNVVASGADRKMSQPEKLAQAFRNGEVRLRLHGTRLPAGYTVSLRLTRDRVPIGSNTLALQVTPRSSPMRGRSRATSPSSPAVVPSPKDSPKPEDFNEDNIDADIETLEAIRAENAYPGSFNTVGSIHQRWWFLALDKANSGFVKGKSKDGKITWSAGNEGMKKDYPFFVRGREVERSVVTGRRAADVLRDEGVVGFTPRSGWKPALT